MKRLLIPILALVLSIGFMVQAHAASYVDVTPQEAKMLIDKHKDLVIIDVSPVYARGTSPPVLSTTL